MAGRIWIPPYKPLGVSTQAVPGGGYLAIDAIAGQFGPSPMLQFGLQAAEGAAGVATVLSEHLAGDNEAIVKGADARLGETEQALLFDPTSGYLNLQGQDALTQAPAVIDAYREAQTREMATMVDDDQRRMLQDLSERRLASFSTQVERHTATERQRWYDQAGERRIAQMQADARLHWSDDAMLRRALGTTRAEVNEQAERHHWDSALTEATLSRQTSRTLVSAIEAAVERDPERARSLHTRYEQHIEASDRARLDALLAEAQTREHARRASTELLNATPPDGEPSVAQWRLRQAEAITDPAVRAATIRTLHSVAVADEARAQTLAEQVLARVLKDGLTDPAQIPVRDWVALDAEHREAIETRLDHNAAGTEPAPNPALIDELATEMTEAPTTFARRDLVPTVAQLPLPQWQRLRDWQAGLRRRDPTTESEVYAIKRGLQLAQKRLPTDLTDDDDANHRADLVEEIDTWRRINGKGPDNDDIDGILQRYVSPVAFVPLPPTLRGDPRSRPEIHRVQDANSAALPANAAAAALARATAMAAAARLAEAAVRAALAIEAAPMAGAAGAMATAQALAALNEAIRAFSDAMDDEAKHYPYIGNRQRILKRNAADAAAQRGYVPADNPPIDARGEAVFVHPDTGDYIVRATDVRTPGVWVRFDRHGNRIGFFSEYLLTPYPDPPLNPAFPWPTPLPDAARPHAIEANPPMTPEEKAKWAAEQKAKQAAAQKERERLANAQGGLETPEPDPEPEPDDDSEDEDAVEITVPDPGKPWQKVTRYKTDKAAAKAAAKLGYHRVKNPGFATKKRAVFWNPETKDFISRDIDSHRGTWKRFEKGNPLRTGTWNADLTVQVGP
ncbi:MAG: toxin C-terminal domain-containing protein [Alphaproteobacteria bacterium]|nr:toxin C-terminal domain-containing protein [Alphaproteobacteria bacterium]